MEENRKKECMYVYHWVTVLRSWDFHLVDQLCLNREKESSPCAQQITMNVAVTMVTDFLGNQGIYRWCLYFGENGEGDKKFNW